MTEKGFVTMDEGRIHKRIDDISKNFNDKIGEASKKFEENSRRIIDVVSEVASDVKVIKSTCKVRGETCAKQVFDLDQSIRGNGSKGVLARMGSLEESDKWKSKLIFAAIGCILTIISSIAVFLVINFANKR